MRLASCQRQAGKVDLKRGGCAEKAVVEAAEGASHRHAALEGGDVQGAPAIGVGVGGELVGVAGLEAMDLVLEHAKEAPVPGRDHVGTDCDAVEGIAQ